MKLHRTLLTLALGSLFATSAYATGDDAIIFNLTETIDATVTTGFVDVYGEIEVAAKSSAVVDQDQFTESNTSLGDGDHDADLTDNALRGAQGNIGANVAAGVGNAQANDAALSAVDGDKVFASAMVFNSQASFDNIGASGGFNETYYSANLDGNALQNAKGNIGVNVAAGVGNGQTNALAASVNSSGSYALATADSEQDTLFNLLATNCDLDTFAFFGDNAMQNAQGNIGANVAAGVGNLQHNGLSIASASCGTCD